jgi:acyl-coenzyme A thioesterase PaaI-like protein
MDATGLARQLLEPIPAHATARLEVLEAADGAARVALTTPPTLTNVIGSPHASGLITLVDAAGLAAIIAACRSDRDMDGVLPLGAAASLEFLSPAGGRLVAAYRLTPLVREALELLFSGEENRIRLRTDAEILDEAGAVVCRGSMEWSVRRAS